MGLGVGLGVGVSCPSSWLSPVVPPAGWVFSSLSVSLLLSGVDIGVVVRNISSA